MTDSHPREHVLSLSRSEMNVAWIQAHGRGLLPPGLEERLPRVAWMRFEQRWLGFMKRAPDVLDEFRRWEGLVGRIPRVHVALVAHEEHAVRVRELPLRFRQKEPRVE